MVLKTLVTSVLSIGLFLTLVIVLVPIHLFRWVISKVCKLKSGFVKIVPNLSSAYVSEDIETYTTYNIGILFEIEGPLDLAKFQETVAERIIYLKDEHDKLVYPEFQQYLAYWMGFPFYKWEENFEINDHVQIYQYGNTITTKEETFNSCMEHLNTGFKPDKSLWQIILVETETSYTVFLKIHHSIGDGQSIFNALMNCCDYPVIPLLQPTARRTLTIKQSIINGYNVLAGGISILNRIFFNQNEKSLWNFPSSQLTEARSYAVTRKISLADVKTFCKQHNVSVSSFILCGVTGAITKFLLATNDDVQETYSCILPFHNYPKKERLTTKVAAAMLDLPAGKGDTMEHISDIQKIIQIEKEYQSYKTIFLLFTLLGGFRRKLRVLQGTPLKFSPLYLGIFPVTNMLATVGGHPITDMYYNISFSKAFACSIAAMSYNDSLRIAVSMDKNICETNEDAQKLTLLVEERMKQLLHFDSPAGHLV